MLNKKVEKALNAQIRIEAESSQVYLSMASWAEVKGLEGIAQFMYKHSDEERMHMLKLVKFVNERGGHAVVSELNKPKDGLWGFPVHVQGVAGTRDLRIGKHQRTGAHHATGKRLCHPQFPAVVCGRTN